MISAASHREPVGREVLAMVLLALLIVGIPGRAATLTVAYDAQDCTANLQAALNDSSADTIVIPFTGSSWTTGPLWLLRSNVTLKIEPGVELVAKNGAFPHGSCLLQVQLCHDVKITGYGAILRMLNGTDPSYNTEENRHCLALRAVDRVLVEGLKCTKAGGDGIYISGGWEQSEPAHCSDVTIQNCTLDDNRRQGISVISVQDLLIQGCLMSNTGATNGTDPMSGIDFEPYLPTQRLVRCVVRDCSMIGNRALNYASGIHSYLGYLDGTSLPVSIRIERCHITSKEASGVAVNLSGASDGGPATDYALVECLIEDTRGAGLKLNSGRATTTTQITRTILRNTFTDIVTWNNGGTPIYLEGQSRDIQAYGNITFTDCLVIDGKARSFIRSYEDRSSFRPPLPATRCDGLRGNITVINPNAAGRVYNLDFNNDANTTLAVTGLSSMPSQTVSITALSPATSAGSSAPATVLVSRTGANLSIPLAVDLTWGGTAINGNEYAFRPGFVILPAMAASVPLTLTARPGALVGSGELATVTVSRRTADYSTVAGARTSILHVFGTPLPAWRFNAFGDSADSGIAANNADPDRDSVPNFIEYALGGNPLAADAASINPTPVLGSNRFEFTFHCDVARTDIDYIVQAGSDLAAWTDIARSTGGATTVPINGSGAVIGDSGIGRRIVTVSGIETGGQGTYRFARLKIVPR